MKRGLDRPSLSPKRYKRNVRTTVVLGGLLILSVILPSAVPDLANEDDGRKAVTLILHAADKNGNPAPFSSLLPLEVTERDEKLQIISGPTTPVPEQVALVVDSNFHQAQVLQLEKETVEHLLSRFDRTKTQALVMNYGTAIHVSGALTDDLNSVSNFTRSIQADTDKHNETILLFDALKDAMDALHGASGNKAIVLFAEGNGNGNSVRRQALVPLAQRNHIACYVVLFADHTFYGARAIRRYGWDLVDLAPKTGGKFWEAGSNARRAEAILMELQREMISQATIRVVASGSHSQAYHRVEITSAGRRLQAQTGYFDFENK